MGRTGERSDGATPHDQPTRIILAKLVRESRGSQRAVALDTPALIAYIEDREPAASLLAPIVEDPRVPISVSVVTLAEILTLPALHNDDLLMRSIRRAVLALPGIAIVEIDEETAVQTAIIRAKTGLKLPDAAIVACARIANACAIIGNDRGWRSRPLGIPYIHLDDIVELAASSDI